MKKEIIKLAGILCAITMVAALLLACVNKITFKKIKESEMKAAEDARSMLISGAEFKDAKGYDNVKIAMIDGQFAGYCVNVSVKGFGGPVEMMVGIGADDTVTGVEILSHSETAGLGAKADTDDFKKQFPGKYPELAVVKTPTENPAEIQAITGATVTSKAVAEGIKQAYEITLEVKGGEN